MQVCLLAVVTKKEDKLKRLQVNQCWGNSLNKLFTRKASGPRVPRDRFYKKPQSKYRVIIGVQLYRFDDLVQKVIGELYVQLLQDLWKVFVIHEEHQNVLLLGIHINELHFLSISSTKWKDRLGVSQHGANDEWGNTVFVEETENSVE